MKKQALKLTICVSVLLGSCAKPKALQYLDIANLDVGVKNLAKPVISADLRFYNPNNYSLKMKRAEMDVMVNNHYVGHSLLDSTIDIPKLDSFSIPVKLDVDLKAVIARSLGVLLNDEVDLSLKGTAKVGKAGIYKNFPFTYQKKQKLDLFK